MGNSQSAKKSSDTEPFKSIFENNIQNALLFIQQNPSTINNRWRNESTVLMESVLINSIDLVRQLIIYGVDINVADTDGYTALHHAVEKSAPESVPIIQLLLENKANPKVRTNAGNLAIELLKMDVVPLPYQRQIVEELQKYTRYTFREKLDINPNFNRENIVVAQHFLPHINDKLVGDEIDSTIYSIDDGKDYTILDYLTSEGRDSLVFLFGKTQNGISASALLKYINDGTFVYYECNTSGGVFPNPNIVYIDPFVRLPLVFSPYITYEDAKLMMSNNHSFWEIIETPIVLNYTISESFILSKDAVGADHCQAGSSKRVYKLRPYNPVYPPPPQPSAPSAPSASPASSTM